MKIIRKNQAFHVNKQGEINVYYYLFKEYEVHYNEQNPHTSQVWHHHDKVWESIYIIEGELIAKWRENGDEKREHLKPGDFVETERSPHTFINDSGNKVKFLVLKQIPQGKDNREILKNDKVID